MSSGMCGDEGYCADATKELIDRDLQVFGVAYVYNCRPCCKPHLIDPSRVVIQQNNPSLNRGRPISIVVNTTPAGYSAIAAAWQDLLRFEPLWDGARVSAQASVLLRCSGSRCNLQEMVQALGLHVIDDGRLK